MLDRRQHFSFFVISPLRFPAIRYTRQRSGVGLRLETTDLRIVMDIIVGIDGS